MGFIAIIVWLIVLAIPVFGLFTAHKQTEEHRSSTRRSGTAT